MNEKFVLVGVASALFAAGLTYWLVAPIESQERGVEAAKVVTATPARPPLVISPAGPEPVGPESPGGPAPVVAASKPSPTGAPVLPPEAPQIIEPAPIMTKPAEPAGPAPLQPETATPAPSASAPPPPEHVALSPPKEADRPAEPAVLRDRPIRPPNTVTIDQGTMVYVRIGETLTAQKNLTGDTFFATLDAPLVADGFVIAEKGARVEGKIIEVDKAGKLSGTSRLSLELTQVNTSDGQRVHLQTSTYTKDGADRNHKDDAAKIGGGAVIGAVIGAAAGGGKGAVIGAGAGGAAGGGAVLLSGGRNLTIPVETKLSFRVERPITITERVVQ